MGILANWIEEHKNDFTKEQRGSRERRLFLFTPEQITQIELGNGPGSAEEWIKKIEWERFSKGIHPGMFG